MNGDGTPSSNVAEIDYDDETRVMAVSFHSGRTYNLIGVSPADHEAFVAADSKGKHFHRHLRGMFGPKMAA